MRSIPKNITKELLEKLYVNENKSLREIGNLVKKSQVQVSRYLKKFNIKARPFSTKGLSPQLGKVLSEETKDKIRKAHLGKKLSKETKKKISLSNKGKRLGKDNPSWKGGRVTVYSDGKLKKDRVKGTKGYVWLKLPNHPRAYKQGYYPEHRYVVEQNIGRLLGKWEHIHHINGIKDDNRFENLELINAQTHNLITMLENRVKELEKENEILRKRV